MHFTDTPPHRNKPDETVPTIRRRSRSLRILLCFALFLTGALGLLTAAPASAASTGSGASFCNAGNGGGVSSSGSQLDGVYPCANPNISDSFGYQCVEYSSRFESVVYGVPASWTTGPGSAVVNELHQHGIPASSPNGTSGGSSAGPNLPAVGDVVSMSGPGQDAWGHTGVVAAVNVTNGSGSITYYDQNGWQSHGVSRGYDQINVTPARWSDNMGSGFDYTVFNWTTQGDRDNRAVMVRHHGGGGYTVSPSGTITPFGGAPVLAPSATWPGQDIVRAAVLRSDDLGGYILDLFGGIHPFGNAPAVGGGPYWPGWDIARGLVLRSNNISGYVLDGYGGVHPFGGAPTVSASAYWAGWDIATGIATYDDNGGYVLDGYGGIHPYGDAPAVSGSAYWPGWNIARAIITTHDGLGAGGYVLDGYGGMHPFGDASPVAVAGYHNGLDTAVAVAMTANGATGWEVDTNGRLTAVAGPTSACTTCS